MSPYRRVCVQVRYDPNNGEVEGWLYKQSAWLKGAPVDAVALLVVDVSLIVCLRMGPDWRRRYFILLGTKLFFAKDDQSTPHGLIDLADCPPKRHFSDPDPIRSADDDVGREFAIAIVTREATYQLIASNHVEKDRWMTAFRKAAEYSSRVLTNEEDLEDSEISFR